MGAIQTEISKSDLNAMFAKRVTLEPSSNVDTLFGKIINYPVELTLFRNPNTFIKDFHFNDCIFNESVVMGNNQSAGKVFFSNCVFNENVAVEPRISFEKECKFKKNLAIKCSGGYNHISGLCVDGTLTVSGDIISLININVQERLIKNQKIVVKANCNELKVESIYGSEIAVENIQSEGITTLKDVNTHKLVLDKISSVDINASKIKEFEFDNIYGKSKRLSISTNSIINTLKLPMYFFDKVDISDCNFDKIELSGANQKESILNIEKVIITEFIFHKLFNSGLITLRELTIPNGGIVSIKSSNLGKSDFINCDFSKAELEFENSKITEAFFSETDFPKIIHTNKVKNYSQAQLAFGQLATAFQKQGDTVRALEYNSRELQAHYGTLRWFSKELFKKFNLWLNFISNNFGRYWVLAVIFSFGVGLLFFCALLISTDQYHFGIPHFDDRLIPAFLKFMNPLRFIDTEDLFKKHVSIELNGWSYFWDFLGRVFVAYGFYQTIQAFRRFGRK